MTHQERLKVMREWVKELKTTQPQENKKIESLNWAIKICLKHVSKKSSKNSYY